jgi:hypothetical protein
MMSFLNGLIAALLDGLLFPFRGLPAIAGLAALSLLTAIALLLVVKKTSNQARLRDVKRLTQAGFFEIRLFNDDLRQILRAQLDILRHTLTYVTLSLVPLLWTIVPLTLVLAHLQFEYGYAGLEPGQSAVVTVTMKDEGSTGGGTTSGTLMIGGPVRPELTLTAPDGVRVETPPVWIPSRREASWRVGAVREGAYDLALQVGSRPRDTSPAGTASVAIHTTKILTKRVVVSRATMALRSPVRHDGGFLDTLLYPAEKPLPADSPIASIAITYPEQHLSVAGFELHWTIIFFGLSLLFALALRRPFRVVI